MKAEKYIFVLLFLISITMLCEAQENIFPDDKENDYLYATLWYQRSQEAKANILSLYKLATLMLDQALQAKNWSAAPGEQKDNFEDKPPAVILDIDETVLDNSPFTAWLIDKGMYYNSELWEDWERWIAAARARALPGVVDFVRYAQSKKVKVFFISNRVASQEAATRKNLQAVGLKLEKNMDTILLRKEKPGWDAKKSSRRKVVAGKYRILLLIGDNLGDFVDNYETNYQERDKF